MRRMRRANRTLRRAGTVGPDPDVGRSARRIARERQLVGAAMACISRLGLEATTVQAVAAAAGMAVGSINQYFRTKERLLTAVLVALAEEFERAWREALAGCEPDPAARLDAFVGCYFRPEICRREKIAVWYAFWGEVAARPQYRRVCAGYDRRHGTALVGLCADLIDRGDYAPMQPASSARLIAAVCHGLWLEFLTAPGATSRETCRRTAAETLRAVFPKHGPAFGAAAGGSTAGSSRPNIDS
jgi:TetR/AcrR family transcriptional repressor of bet genes